METPAENSVIFNTGEPMVEVLSIGPDGRIVWRGKEVESDDDFRAAMLDLAFSLRTMRPSERLSKEDYKILYQADLEVDGGVARVLNRNGKCNWTVCPECGSDDFVHVEDCSLGVECEG